MHQSLDRSNVLEYEVSRAQSKVYLLGSDPIRLVSEEYHHAVLDQIVSTQVATTLQAAAEVDISNLTAIRGLLLAAMNRVLGIALFSVCIRCYVSGHL